MWTPLYVPAWSPDWNVNGPRAGESRGSNGWEVQLVTVVYILLATFASLPTGKSESFLLTMTEFQIGEHVTVEGFPNSGNWNAAGRIIRIIRINPAEEHAMIRFSDGVTAWFHIDRLAPAPFTEVRSFSLEPRASQ